MRKLRLVPEAANESAHTWTTSAPDCLLIVVRGEHAHLETTSGRFFDINRDAALQVISGGRWAAVADGVCVAEGALRVELGEDGKSIGVWSITGIRLLTDVEWDRFCQHKSIWPDEWFEPGYLHDPGFDAEAVQHQRLLEAGKQWLTWRTRNMVNPDLSGAEAQLSQVLYDLGVPQNGSTSV